MIFLWGAMKSSLTINPPMSTLAQLEPSFCNHIYAFNISLLNAMFFTKINCFTLYMAKVGLNFTFGPKAEAIFMQGRYFEFSVKK